MKEIKRVLYHVSETCCGIPVRVLGRDRIKCEVCGKGALILIGNGIQRKDTVMRPEGYYLKLKEINNDS